jgi:hypothetical protein
MREQIDFYILHFSFGFGVFYLFKGADPPAGGRKRKSSAHHARAGEKEWKVVESFFYGGHLNRTMPLIEKFAYTEERPFNSERRKKLGRTTKSLRSGITSLLYRSNLHVEKYGQRARILR